MSEQGLGPRTWIWARGVPLLLGGLTLAGVAAAVALTDGRPRTVQVAVLLGVLALGGGLYLLARRTIGRDAVRRRVGAARERWAAGTPGWSYLGDGAVPPEGSAVLALPSGWRPPRAVAALTGRVEGRQAEVQTWMLEPRATARRRRPSAREVVIVQAATGEHRCAVLSTAPLDHLLITPAWASPGRDDLDAATGTLSTGDPAALAAWGTAIRAAVAALEGVPFTVTVGGDQVVLLALDDPRTSTMQARLELAAQVARIVDPLPATSRDAQ